MRKKLHPIVDQFAMEVKNTALLEIRDDADFGALDQALSEFGVLVFRRQAVSEEELINFSRQFGSPEKIVRSDWASIANPEVTHISNMRNAAGTAIGGLGSGELNWHTDQSYMAQPATGAVLVGVEVPENGPDTFWANLALAYEALPAATKTLIENKRGIFSYAKRVSAYDQEITPEEVRKKTPDVLHRLVNLHPRTGQKSLYLDPATTVGVDGMPEDEGIDLLAELAAHATATEFVYQHKWQTGDIVMWDNGFLLHRRDAFPVAQNRLLKRTTIRLSDKQHFIPSN